MPQGIPPLTKIERWLETEYNAALSVYKYDDHVRLTNGSAAHYVDIYVANGQSFALEGEKYGETITESCDATRDALIETLSHVL